MFALIDPNTASTVNNTVDQIMKRLDALGQKLGIAAGALWGIYVRQGYVTGLQDAFTAGFCALLLIACIVLWVLFVRSLINNGAMREGDGGVGAACGFLLAVVSIGGCCGFFSYAQDAIMELYNPQYWAITHLLADIKNIL